MKKLILLFLFFVCCFVYSQQDTKGKNIYSLLGTTVIKFEPETKFEDYTVLNFGAYMIDDKYYVECFFSDTKIFYLLVNYENNSYENRKLFISDILEIDKKYLKRGMLTEYCETKIGNESEIIALVKKTDKEYSIKIIKAWHTNLQTGKFEKINPKKIVKCPNHNYGI